jgi:hypothetical protein
MAAMDSAGWLRHRPLMLLVLVSIALIGETMGAAADGSQLFSMDIRATDTTKRLEADQNLVALRKALFDDLIKTFDESEDKTFNGPKHLAIKQMGIWRFEEAIALLTRHLDWSLNTDTLPHGKKYPPWIVYPAAIALREIGGRTVRAAMIATIQNTTDETKLKVSSWVLSSIDGAEVASRLLSETMKESGREIVTKRLEKAVSYAGKGDAVFGSE